MDAEKLYVFSRTSDGLASSSSSDSEPDSESVFPHPFKSREPLQAQYERCVASGDLAALRKVLQEFLSRARLYGEV